MTDINPCTPSSLVDVWVELSRLDERIKTVHLLFEERDKQRALAFQAQEKATEKAQDAQAKVNITQNEFRGALKDQAAMLATKEDLQHTSDRVQALDKLITGTLVTRTEFGLLREAVQLLQQADSSESGGRRKALSSQTFLFNLLPLLLSFVMALITIGVLIWKSKT
jgi:hypothetical protein